MLLKAAIIGLGQVGSRFDEEAGRKTVWSHAGAYLAEQDRFEIVAAADPDPTNAAAFRIRCPGVEVLNDYRELLRSKDLDVVSICTPANTHTDVLTAVFETTNVNCIWLEKPAALLSDEARQIQRYRESRSASIYVSHVRRWSPLWLETRRRLDEGEIGQLHHIMVKLPNRLWSIGSHAVDLALFLGRSFQAPKCIALPNLAQDDEPAVAVCGTSAEGAMLSVIPTGMKNQLMVEVEAIGSEGRLVTDELTGTISLQKFQSSANYTGYSSLAKPVIDEFATLADQSPFVAIARDIANNQTPLCSYDDAVRGLELLELMAKAADQPCETYE